MFELFFSYFSFMVDQLSGLASSHRIWCFYEQFGLRVIIMLVNGGIVAFAIPNILDQSECKPDRDSYIKSLFERKHRWMKINSRAMLFLAIVTILTYLAIWNAVFDQDVCRSVKVISGNPERFSRFLAVTNFLTIFTAVFALNQKIFCMKHKQ